MDLDSDVEECDSTTPRKSAKCDESAGSTQKMVESIDLEEDDEVSAEFTNVVIEFLLEGMHPVSMINEKSFRKLLSKLRPGCSIPSIETVQDRVDYLHAVEKAKLHDLLHSVNYVSISADCWKSHNRSRYITLTANFIDDDWRLNSFVIETVKPTEPFSWRHFHTMLADLSFWDIRGKVVAVVHNMLHVDPLNKEFNIPCAATSMQESLRGVFTRAPQIADLIDRCKRLVSHFHLSKSASIYLTKYQKASPMDVQCDQLVSPDDANPITVFKMMDDLLTQRNTIEAVLADLEVTSPKLQADLSLTEAHWQLLELVVNFLKPMSLLLNGLDSYSSLNNLSFIKPTVFRMCDGFLKLRPNEENDAIRGAKCILREDMLRKYNLHGFDGKCVGEPDYLDCASFLDPRYKSLEYLGQNAAVIREKIKEKFLDSVLSMPSTSKPPNGLRENQEWARYLDEPEIKRNMSALKWWKTNKNSYPNLSDFAKKHLCSRAAIRMYNNYQMEVQCQSLPQEDVDKTIFLSQNVYNMKRSVSKIE